MRWRVRYSGATAAGVTSDVAGDSGERLGEAAGAGASQAAPASMKSARTASRIVTLVPQRAADGSFELVQRGPEVAHRTEMLERRLAVGPLGVEEVEEAGAPPTVRELDGRTGLLRLRQVGIAQHDDPVALDRHRGQRGIDLGERLDSRRPRQRVRPLRLGARTRDFTLIAIEDLEREAEPEADRVVGSDPLVLDLRCHVPPRVRARQVHVGARLVPRGPRGLEVGAVGQGEPAQLVALQRDVAVVELADDVERVGQRVGPDDGPQGDLRGLDRLPRVAGVTLEREALDLQTKQLELGNVALLGPDPLKALDVVERPEVLLGEGERRPGDENTGEGALDLRDHQSPDVVQLVARGPRRRASAVDPALALAAGLDGLGEDHRVLRQGRTTSPELLGAVRRGGVGPKRGRDLVGADRLELRPLRAERRVVADRGIDRILQGEAVQTLLRAGDAGDQGDAETHEETETSVPAAPPRGHAHGFSAGHGGAGSVHERSTAKVPRSTLLMRPERSPTWT